MEPGPETAGRDAAGAGGGEAGRSHRVVLAVTGSIAAYKACEVLRRLQDEGVEVRVAMTAGATRLVGPTTFAALSGHRVVADTFDDPRPWRLAHVRWGAWCDAFCVAPATADFLAKMALGIADDFPSTLHLTAAGPVLVAPAMEDRMWAHPAVQSNVGTLLRRGVVVVEPGEGHLASGRTGAGRLAEPSRIVDGVLDLLGPAPSGPLHGRRVLVTAGPTREHLDPVRVLTNPSSGKMGFALARQARRLGARVVLVSGPVALDDPPGVDVERVVTTAEMAEAVRRRATDADVVVMAAAVTDFGAAQGRREKLSKADAAARRLELEPTEDILEALAGLPGERLLVGFAAETSEVEERAREKLERKGCDLIVANRVGVAGQGFGSDDNAVVILDRLGGRQPVGPASKDEVAAGIWQRVVAFRRQASREWGGEEPMTAAP